MLTAAGWYVHTVPGPSPRRFSSSLTKVRPQPLCRHVVPGETTASRSSSSSTTTGGGAAMGAADAAVRGAEALDVYTSLPSWVSETERLGTAECVSFGSSGFGGVAVCGP